MSRTHSKSKNNNWRKNSSWHEKSQQEVLPVHPDINFSNIFSCGDPEQGTWMWLGKQISTAIYIYINMMYVVLLLSSKLSWFFGFDIFLKSQSFNTCATEKKIKLVTASIIHCIVICVLLNFGCRLCRYIKVQYPIPPFQILCRCIKVQYPVPPFQICSSFLSKSTRLLNFQTKKLVMLAMEEMEARKTKT